MQFSYTARNAQGATSEGILEAADKYAVAKELRARNEIAVSVEEVSEKGAGVNARFSKLFAHVTLREKILFTHNLSGMLTAGLTLYRALEVLKKQNQNPAMTEVIDGLLATINGGGTLSDGLMKFQKVFPTLFISMVRAGEESGKLANTLNDIGASLQKSYDLTRKIKGAMTYPGVIVSAIIVIGTLMLIFVVPTLTNVFAQMGGKLPAATQFIITVSNFVAHHPIIFFGSIALLISGVLYVFRSKKTQRFSDKVILRLPAISFIVQEVNTARTARTLSSLLSSGVDMTRALEITRDVLQNLYYKDVITQAIETVQKGGALSSVFKEHVKLYPVMMGEMVAVGEETGALTQMLADVAAFYEDEVDAKTKNLSTIIEPVLMVFIGGAVGFFAIAMISPIYSLMSNLPSS